MQSLSGFVLFFLWAIMAKELLLQLRLLLLLPEQRCRFAPPLPMLNNFAFSALWLLSLLHSRSLGSLQLHLASHIHRLTQLRCLFSLPFISPPDSALSSLTFLFLLPASEFWFLSVFVGCTVHTHFDVLLSFCIWLRCLWFVAFNAFSAMCFCCCFFIVEPCAFKKCRSASKSLITRSDLSNCCYFK